MKHLRAVLFVLLFLCAGFPWGRGAAFGYAGEAGTSAGLNPPVNVSTHHTHLTRALAYCAGLPAMMDRRDPVNPLVASDIAATEALAEIIALNDELTDQGTLTNGTVTWSNFNTSNWTYTLSDNPTTYGCPADATKRVYPIRPGEQPDHPALPDSGFFDPAAGWFTNRFGPWAPLFHFPDSDGQCGDSTPCGNDLDKLRAFAYGTPLTAVRTSYAFGPSTANYWTGTCYKERLETLQTGDKMTPGSAAAFGTYLHSLADSHSHGYCHRHWAGTAGAKPTWYYHTPEGQAGIVFVDGCDFDDHLPEFGCPDSQKRAEFVQGTVEGGIEVFDQLEQYAKANQHTPRITLATYGSWLRRQLERYAILFDTSDDPEAGPCRVSYAYELMKACQAIADTNPCDQPDIIVSASDSFCPSTSAGRTQGCETGNGFISLTPTCPASKAAAAR